jgi:hypothetical protein
VGLTDNRAGASPKNGIAYKEGKESRERKPFISPVGNKGRNQTHGQTHGQTQPPKPSPCIHCDGCGVLGGESDAPVSHKGTLADVRDWVRRHGAYLCRCESGKAWEVLLLETEKGPGEHKSKMAPGAAQWKGETV